jgi:cytochrome P450
VKLPPGPRGLPLIGSAHEFFRDQTGFLQRTARAYGDISSFRLGPQQVILINHPDLVREVLVTRQRSFKKGRGLERARRLLGDGLLTSEGELHVRQRRLAQPAFHRDRIASYARTMVEYAARAVDRWPDGGSIDVAEELGAIAMAITGKTLFDHDVEQEVPDVGAALTLVMDIFWRAMLPFSELLERLPLSSARRFDAARRRLDEIIYGIIRERRRSGRDHGDLLSMLLLAQEDGAGMSDEQLRDEVLTILLAGHETTALALTWTLYLLSQHPDISGRVRREVSEAIGARPASVEDVAKLEYLRMVIAEAMRLYPPAWIVARRALEELELGGYRLPRRALVFASQYLLHRDPRFFPDPERFDPERWRPEAEATRPKFAYFPFGGGARVCVGESFAWMEAVLVLATIVQRRQWELVPGHPVDIKPSITLRAKHGMKMIVRSDRRLG